MGSSIVTSIVRTACDRDEARFKLVAPTDRCFVAALERIRIRESEHNFFPHLYKLSNSSTAVMGIRVRLATKTMPLSFSRTGSLGAYMTMSA